MQLKCLLPVELDHIQTIPGTPDLSVAVAENKDKNLFQHTTPPPCTEIRKNKGDNIFNFSRISARLPSGKKYRQG